MASKELDPQQAASNFRWGIAMWTIVALSFLSAFFARHILFHTVFQ